MFLTCVSAVGAWGALSILLGTRQRLATTTLRTALWWAIAACALWATILTADSLWPRASPEWSSLGWYAAGVLALCPGIAVLGARRPGAGVWNGFVLVPLVAVLGWPALTFWSSGPAPQRLLLEAPALIGFLLVLGMGAGNYAGTRYAHSAGLLALAECLLLAPVAAATATWFPAPQVPRLWATLCLSLAVVVASLQARRTRPATTGFDRVWLDFRDTFGIVWARRVQERINERAATEGWPVALHSAGFAWTAGTDDATRAQTSPRIEHTLRWLLRRFVDDAWVDARIGR
jgi:hypothetical protein